MQYEEIYARFEKRHEETYFMGVDLKSLFLDDVFWLLASNIGVGFCYELAAIGMLVMDFADETRIIHGVSTSAKQRSGMTTEYRHAIVEARFGEDYYVYDPMWLRMRLTDKEEYFERYNFEVCWSMSDIDFWNDKYAASMMKKFQSPETSYDVIGLRYFRPRVREPFGFSPKFKFQYPPETTAEEIREEMTRPDSLLFCYNGKAVTYEMFKKVAFLE